MSNTSELMVVAKEVSLKEVTSIKNGKFNQNGAYDVVHESKIVPRHYVDRVNGEHGKKFYIVDEDATAELANERNKNLQRNAEEAKLKNVGTNDLLRALIAESQAKQPIKEKSELDLLRERCDELGIEYKKTHGKSTLKGLIEKAEQDED